MITTSNNDNDNDIDSNSDYDNNNQNVCSNDNVVNSNDLLYWR